MIKEQDIQHIEYIPIEIAGVPGISENQLDYTSQIGGSGKPDENADKTSENPQALSWITDAGDLAALDYVNTTQILDDAISTAKLKLLSVTTEVLANNAVTASKVTTGELITLSAQIKDATIIDAKIGTVSANKIVAGTGIINSLSVLSTLTMGSSATNGYIQSYGWNGTANGFQIKGGSSPAVTIIGGTITGGTIRTAASGKRCQLDGANNIISIFDSSRERMRMTEERINFINTLGNTTGTIYSTADTVLQVECPYGNNLILNAVGSLNGVYMQNAGNDIAFVGSAGLSMISGKAINIPQATGSSTPLTVGSYSFRPVGFTFKDGSGNNKYLIVLATADPVTP